MIISKSVRVAALIALAILSSSSAFAQIDARMFRQPSVSKDQIAFVYAGDIWVVPKKGGTAASSIFFPIAARTSGTTSGVTTSRAAPPGK